MADVIALVGMGLLGSALAENLLAAGFAVRGYDVDAERMRQHAERGGALATSPADAARGASVVMTWPCSARSSACRPCRQATPMPGRRAGLDAAGRAYEYRA